MGVNPIRQLEEAISLLRQQSLRAWSFYLLGVVPFLLTLLKFVQDMAAEYLAGRCAFEAALCALAFFWASAWKAKFGSMLLISMNGIAVASPRVSFVRTLYRQSVLQTAKLLAWPLALIAVIPFAWTSSFFRNATIEAGLPENTLGLVIAKSAKRANVNARGQWVGLAVLILVSLLVFLNVYMLAALLPFLIRMFSGVETEFTRSIGRLFTFNVCCAVLALTLFFLDPLFLAYSVIRCFYAEARSDGRDLLARLAKTAAAVLICLLFVPERTYAAQTPPAASISQQDLSKSLAQAVKSDDYYWVRVKPHPENDENSFFARLNRDVEQAFKKVGSWLNDFIHWLRHLGDQARPHSGISLNGPATIGDVRWLLYSLAGIVVIALLVFLWKARNSGSDSPLASSPPTGNPDLNKENILASDLPEEEWLRIARELLQQGDLRLAVRALYLSNLAYLGAQRFIQIARSKSNSIYEREVRQRPLGSTLAPPFCHANRNFERVWYGFDTVTPEFIETFEQDVEAIRQHAQS